MFVRTNTACFHLYEVSKLVTLIEAGIRMVAARGCGVANGELFMGIKFQLCTRMSSRGLFPNTVPVVNNNVWCTYTITILKRTDLMLSAPTTRQTKTKT